MRAMMRTLPVGADDPVTGWNTWEILHYTATWGMSVWEQFYFFYDFIGKYDNVQFQWTVNPSLAIASWAQNNVRRTHLIARSNPVR
jgi:hypothetical protein